MSKQLFENYIRQEYKAKFIRHFLFIYLALAVIIIGGYVYLGLTRIQRESREILSAAKGELLVSPKPSRSVSTRLDDLCSRLSCNLATIINADGVVVFSIPDDGFIGMSALIKTENHPHFEINYLVPSTIQLTTEISGLQLVVQCPLMSLLKLPIVLLIILSAASLGFFMAAGMVTHIVAGLLGEEVKSLISAFSMAQSAPEADYNFKTQESEILFKQFQEAKQQLLEFVKEKSAVEQTHRLGLLSAQVAHDIRSPLAALDSVLRDISHLPEEKRIIIRSAASRIHDIANNLLEKHRKAKTNEADKAEDFSIYLLSSLIDPLITEKRLQFRSKIGIEIEGRLDASSYGLFAQIQATEFKRVLSNLINNAVEALGAKGMVVVNLVSKDNQILLYVQDNGKGIPSEILAKLGQRGVSYSKTGGSGLGFYHAKTSVESWGGSLKVESEAGVGTTVTIKLPESRPPDWFVSSLELESGSIIVILDDDTSIHQVWDGRFDSLRAKEYGIEVLHFSTPQELRGWVRSNSLKAQDALYLTDYELLGYQETGLNLVEELNLGERAILVTSRFEEKGILEECLRLKVRMIPKGLAGFVPIKIGSRNGEGTSKKEIKKEFLPKPYTLTPIPCSVVLIDDDKLIHMVWKMAAKSKGLSLKTFKSPQEFLEAGDQFSLETPIYLNSELGNDVKGEDFAKELHAKGFMNLYLATGHSPEKFKDLAYLKAVVGKEPPWE